LSVMHAGQKQGHFFANFSWVVPVVLAIFLIAISNINFLLFHTLAELFAIIVAVLMCVVAWQMYPFTKNNYLMYLGCGYFWVGALDMLHTLSYQGMNIFNIGIEDAAIQFWITTRYLEAILLLSAPWFLNNKLNYRFAFFAYGLAAMAIFLLVSFGLLPIAYIEGEGLTPFKITSEYVIIFMLLIASLYLWNKRQLLDPRIVVIMLLSLVLTMCAELAFTFYVSVYGFSNFVGHIFKFFSYWLIFMAMIRTTLQEPFAVMSRGANTYDAIPDATILVDANGIIHQANFAACELAGASKNELVGESSHKWFHPVGFEENNCPICTSSREGLKISGLEVEDRNKERWLDFTLSPVEGLMDFVGSVETIRNITRRKQVEQQLTDVNELKNSIVENLPAMLFVKRAGDHRYVEWNKAAEELTGLTRDEMLGKNDYDFFTEDEASFYTEMDKKVLSQGRLHDIPEEPMHTKYKGIRQLHTRKIPIFNNHGEASYLLGISQDITSKKETEEMLRRSQKMEAVGQLSGGIAHDFNNQLGIVTGYLEFLKEYLKNEEKQKGWVDNASKAAHRCVELTRQLLLFSRAKAPGKKIVDINHVLNEIEAIIEKSVTPEVEIVYQLEPKIWPVTIDQGELEDTVINMVINSRDAMPDGGKIYLRTSNIYIDNDYVATHPGMKTGEHIMLEIKDSGCGMTDSVIEHVFEPFYTTKPVGKGTGLGLSMVYAFVERYDGSIKINSVVGAGTSIKMYLPRTGVTDDVENAAIQHGRQVELPTGTETILVVDDEVDLLNLAGEYLAALGYSVLKASNATEALNYFSKDEIDLMFSDIVMPGGMNGYELADVVKKDYPQTKVLLSSGYTGKSTGTVYQTEYKELIVAKPYTRQDVAVRVRKLLDTSL